MKHNPGTVGTTFHFTAQIPKDAAAALEESAGAHASFDLTPNWGTVPELNVHELTKAGVRVPDHWGPYDAVVPVVHGRAFYLGEPQLGTGAASFSMKGVNLRTGRKETDDPVSDDPCQSYWAPGKYLPWIDGYVPSDGQAVRQFVPLKGEDEMAFDVARHVGVSVDDPFIDALSIRFFAPKVPKEPKYSASRGGSDGFHFLGGAQSDVMKGGMDTVMLSASPTFRGSSVRGIPESLGEVGMGAGARMRQRHEHNELWTADDFRAKPWHEMTFRLVWVDEWNAFAAELNRDPVGNSTLEQFERRQAEYEATVRRQLGIGAKVQTDVDALPKIS